MIIWTGPITFTYINTKIAKGIGICLKSKKYFSATALMNLYHAFKFPYLIYCVEVRVCNALGKHVQPLINLQNKILKIITPSHRFIGTMEEVSWSCYGN